MYIDKATEENKDNSAKASALLNWLSTAKKASSEYEGICKEAWNEYLAKNGKTALKSDEYKKDDNIVRYPIFFNAIENLQPAYYARTPITVAKRMFDNDDDVARVACLILERLSKYLLEVYPIDTAMTNAVLEFLISGKGTAKIYLEEEVENISIQEPVFPVEDGTFSDSQGMPADILNGVFQDEQGNFFTTITKQEVVKVCTHVLPLSYDDIYFNKSARNWNEVKRIAIKLWLSKEEFKEKFGEDVLNKIPAEIVKERENNTSNDSHLKITEGYEVFEIWDLSTKKVSYLCESFKDSLLLELEDPYKLTGFFPVAPFLMGTKDPKNLFPTPIYIQLKSTIMQLHKLYARIKDLISGLKRKGIVDNSLKDVLDAIDDENEGTLIASSKFQHLVENSNGISNLIVWLPLQELANALVESQNLIGMFEDIFYKISGVPDVIRGITEKGQTATEQQLKGEFYNVRTSWNSQQVQELARKLIEMQCDLALHRMPDNLIASICGFQYLDPNDQNLIPDALNLLRNDQARAVRIDIETDSLTFMNDNVNNQKKNTLITTVIDGIGKLSEVAKNNPSALPLVAKMLLMSIRGMDLGKAYEFGIRDITASLEAQANAPVQDAPPPPDYEMMKLEIEKAKLELEKVKLELQNKDIETNASLKNKELDIDFEKNTSEQQIQVMQQQMNDKFKEFASMIEAQKLELEKARVALSEREKLIEEQRLNENKVLEQIASVRGSQEKSPNIIINTNGAKTKKISMARDEDGNLQGVVQEIEEM